MGPKRQNGPERILQRGRARLGQRDDLPDRRVGVVDLDVADPDVPGSLDLLAALLAALLVD